MFVCNKCWNTIKQCDCDNPLYIEIDDNIYPAIKKLNLLGYTTVFCCEGHINKQATSIQAYIMFQWDKNEKVFDSLPNGWAYDSYNYKKNKHYKYHIIRSVINYNKRQLDKLTDEQKRIIINDNINNLISWVNTLSAR